MSRQEETMVTESFVVELIDRAAERLAASGLAADFDRGTAWFFNDRACHALYRDGAPGVDFKPLDGGGHLTVPASARLDPGRPEQWEDLVGHGPAWVHFAFHRDPAGGWAVSVDAAGYPGALAPEVATVNVAYGEPHTIEVVDR